MGCSSCKKAKTTRTVKQVKKNLTKSGSPTEVRIDGKLYLVYDNVKKDGQK